MDIESYSKEKQKQIIGELYILLLLFDSKATKKSSCMWAGPLFANLVKTLDWVDLYKPELKTVPDENMQIYWGKFDNKIINTIVLPGLIEKNGKLMEFNGHLYKAIVSDSLRR